MLIIYGTFIFHVWSHEKSVKKSKFKEKVDTFVRSLNVSFVSSVSSASEMLLLQLASY